MRTKMLQLMTSRATRTHLKFVTCEKTAVFEIHATGVYSVYRFCTSPSCPKHASCPLSVWCSAARCVCSHHVHQFRETTNRARTCARAPSTHPSQLASLACRPAPNSACVSALQRQSFIICMFAAFISPHQQRGAQPNTPGCSKLSLEGLRIASLVPLVVAMRVVLKQLLENGARPLPQAPPAGA